MKCRARMIDGSPVTFEMTDHGVMYECGENAENGYCSDKVFAERWKHHRTVLVTDFEGEGFSVRAVTPYSRSSEFRIALERSFLERAGVDTATVEYCEGYGPLERTSGFSFVAREVWAPLFPPVVRQPPILHAPPDHTDFNFPGRITYLPAGDPTVVMLDAGYQEWLNIATLEGSRYVTSHGLRSTLAQVWHAMEKARTK